MVFLSQEHHRDGESGKRTWGPLRDVHGGGISEKLTQLDIDIHAKIFKFAFIGTDHCQQQNQHPCHLSTNLNIRTQILSACQWTSGGGDSQQC